MLKQNKSNILGYTEKESLINLIQTTKITDGNTFNTGNITGVNCCGDGFGNGRGTGDYLCSRVKIIDNGNSDYDYEIYSVICSGRIDGFTNNSK